MRRTRISTLSWQRFNEVRKMYRTFTMGRILVNFTSGSWCYRLSCTSEIVILGDPAIKAATHELINVEIMSVTVVVNDLNKFKQSY